MEYKICENCGAKLHFRTQKCPICNTVLTDASKIINDEVIIENAEKPNSNYNVSISDSITNNLIDNTPELDENKTEMQDTTSKIGNSEQPARDYVYKAEVHHSLEFTEPLSNMIKVLLTTITSIFPMMGQLIGIFFGIFFSTYDDRDRKSFGKVLIILSIIMFMLYAYTLMAISNLVSPDTLNNLLK